MTYLSDSECGRPSRESEEEPERKFDDSPQRMVAALLSFHRGQDNRDLDYTEEPQDISEENFVQVCILALVDIFLIYLRHNRHHHHQHLTSRERNPQGTTSFLPDFLPVVLHDIWLYDSVVYYHWPDALAGPNSC